VYTRQPLGSSPRRPPTPWRNGIAVRGGIIRKASRHWTQQVRELLWILEAPQVELSTISERDDDFAVRLASAPNRHNLSLNNVAARLDTRTYQPRPDKPALEHLDGLAQAIPGYQEWNCPREDPCHASKGSLDGGLPWRWAGDSQQRHDPSNGENSTNVPEIAPSTESAPVHRN